MSFPDSDTAQAEQCKDANDVYNVLEKLQIGASHGLLYEHWAQWLEDRGNHTGAMEILQLGIYRCAVSMGVHSGLTCTDLWRVSGSAS